MLRGTTLVADTPTVNGHIYSREILAEAIDEFNARGVDTFGLLGMSDDGRSVDLTRVSHIVRSLGMDESGRVFAEIDFMETPYGIIAKQLNDVSNLVSVGEGKIENNVITDYIFTTFNFCSKSES